MSEERVLYGTEQRTQDMEQEIQKAFNDTVGAVLTYLDEAGVGFATKRAVKAELYELCDKKIKPLGLGEDNDQNDYYERTFG